MSTSDDQSLEIAKIDLDELDKQNAEEEASLRAEIDAIKQEYVEKFGEPSSPSDPHSK